ncbi:MAG: hydroxymethylbilane synthase [Pseudodesulfovibrio sp.]|uniref:Porphobilinogen deaminase n=1 Tax=Pseudodesulfovibrio aespoeensis (strain ATCC 700646 / DSM 10631 / Aspo-2) TaxID=643562 RepID=E6VY17_PSEA9|nr:MULTISPECIES: hydroxymethylbilane synthase [Pseudodesulfovibrio]MBU4191212.1 hydroxymethylbilane synthase [Pseudomonadota bacterium]ADU63831.1 porphobilinogen deaminase [Pseudodesulfovibrio aespoeensis Aspo-2]MBU4244297.1 hydroxymethylbilane synthase [Pseudomonadota bacterium]MBU4377615.1 hydroxymethylbilane synthase [Pseudomonadota bacterium]MBU4475575.1 hydroxymethylbilane synthase [Pseudomonadota bacterium]
MKQLTIATRGSALALWQANHIKDRLEAEHPGLTVHLLKIKTKGDKILDVPLAKVGGKGLFVKEIEEALLDGRAQLAVHSMKDVPTELPEGLEVGVIPEREASTDSLLSVKYEGLAGLPRGAVVGTSSLRRQSQLATLRPDLKIESLRGNLDTRVRKLLAGEFDAIVVATAGLNRLELTAPKHEILGPPDFLPAVAQGALGIEYHSANAEVAAMLQFLNHEPSKRQVLAERGFLTGLDGGCQVPIAAWSVIDGERLRLTGFVADVDGSRPIRMTAEGPVDNAWDIGAALAEKVLAAGGKAILDEVYAREGR